MMQSASIPSANRLLEIVDGFAGRPVLMLVDLVADRFVHGVPKRISREAPVLILAHAGETTTPGGGANAAANVASLGGRALPVGVVGDDAAGEQLLRSLAERGIAVDGVLRRAGYPTPTKTRILAGGRHAIQQQIVRIDVERPQELSKLERQAIGETLARLGAGVSVGVLSDYGYGTVEPALAPTLRAALAPGALLLCDSRHRLREFRGVDGATPNEEEAEHLTGAALEAGITEVAAQGESMRADLAARFLLVTRGNRGMNLFLPGSASAIPVHGTDQVADVTGAGDTVIGTFALALASGASPLEAALLANYAGGVVVMKLGTATLTADELRSAIRSDPSVRERVEWAGS